MIKAPADWVSGESPASWFINGCFLAVSSVEERVRSSQGLFYQGTNPIHEGPTLMPHHFPKAPPPNTTKLGVRVST